MTVRALQDEIVRLKRERDFCILAHAYQSQEILEVADFVGDSFGLSRSAAGVPQQNVLLCGVRFMAETVKILSPEKRVFLSHADAGCPMAEQIDAELVRCLKAEYPGYAVVTYINTTAEVKAESDVCVTSSSAPAIVRKLESDRILFLPDCNLGAWVAEQVPEKQFQFMHGGCPTHLRMGEADVAAAKAAHPSALLLVHPECRPSVTAKADFVGSTTEILRYAEQSAAREFLIGTENSIVEHLQFACPDKRFYPLSKDCVCHNMRLTTLADVRRCLLGEGEEITVPEEIRPGAKRSLDAMIALGG